MHPPGRLGPRIEPGDLMTRHVRLGLALLLLAAPSIADPVTARKGTPALRRTPTHARTPAARTARRARPSAHPARATAPLAASGGMVIAIDPETGRLVPPSREQLLALTSREQNALSRSLDGLLQVRHADGSVSVDLQGRFQEFAVARMGRDGKPVLHCLEDSAAVRRALGPGIVAPALEER
jgi:hypothetical protein